EDVEMFIFPPHEHLQNGMQLCKCSVRRNLKRPPNLWHYVVHRKPELKHLGPRFVVRHLIPSLVEVTLTPNGYSEYTTSDLLPLPNERATNKILTCRPQESKMNPAALVPVECTPQSAV